MSIIQDALRRKEHEHTERPAPAPPPAAPPAPSPAPPPPRPDVRAAPGPAPIAYAYPAPAPTPRVRRGGGRWILSAFLVLVLVGVSAGTAWFFFGLRGMTVNIASNAEPPPPQADAAAPGPEAVPEGAGWPHLKLGSLALAGENSSAFLSGQLIFVGEDIDGVILVEVEAKGVTLENRDGERRFLKQGQEIP